MPLNPAKPIHDVAASGMSSHTMLAQAADPSTWPVGAPAQAAEGSRQIEQLRTELQQQDAMVNLLRQRLGEAEMANILLPWLLLLVAGSLGFAGWMVFRLRKLQLANRQRRRPGAPDTASASMTLPLQADMRASGNSSGPGAAALAATSAVRSAGAKSSTQAKAAPSTPDRVRQSDPSAVTGPQPRRADAATSGPAASGRGGAPDTTLAGAMLVGGQDQARTPAASRPMVGELTQSQPVRPVSVEELLDLEQQVDFFLVLGQEEAAVDLLVSHIRDTGGTSALPFLKLMEVYRLQGNSEGFERIRQRFNQRFNAHAPEWAADFDAGLSLDKYPEVMARLLQVWPRPLDALAELENLLHRRSASVMFDLPAYRDLMLLHALSRDLNEQSPGSAAMVDLLLPLGDEPMDTTSPRPHVAATRSEAQALLEEWASGAEPLASRAAIRAATGAAASAATGAVNRAMLDLDLTEYAPAPREFTRPAAFTEPDLQRDDWRSDMAALDEDPLRQTSKS